MSIPYAVDQSQDLTTQWTLYMSLGVYIMLSTSLYTSFMKELCYFWLTVRSLVMKHPLFSGFCDIGLRGPSYLETGEVCHVGLLVIQIKSTVEEE